ncbi:MAG: hypothetical protein K6T17_01960 [Fimbriimonadales bacterium]|nr:hypothetical protein [Fimbriimonadales bacterium]
MSEKRNAPDEANQRRISAIRVLRRYYKRNGYVRLPDTSRKGKKGTGYKKGYEVRLVAHDRDELRAIRDLLRDAGFRVPKFFTKQTRIVQPVYGIEAVRVIAQLEV